MSFSPFCVTKWCCKQLGLFVYLICHDSGGDFILLTAAAQNSNRHQGARLRRAALTKTSPLVSSKRGTLLKKLSSSLPDLPPSCPAACTAQKLKNHIRRWMSVHDERPPAAAWWSRGSVVVGRPAVVRAVCHPATAATAQKSHLVGSWEECCCWSQERWRSPHPGCSAGSRLLGESEALREGWVEVRGQTGVGPAPRGAGCYRWLKTQMWRWSACLNPWWCLSSVWSGGFGTTPWPAKTKSGKQILVQCTNFVRSKIWKIGNETATKADFKLVWITFYVFCVLMHNKASSAKSKITDITL